MWKKLGEWILRNRLTLLIILFLGTVVMGWFASKVQLSYEFAKAIPTDNPKYKEYLSFKQKFGEDGNLLVIGFVKDNIFTYPGFNEMIDLQNQLKKTEGVIDVLSVVSAVNLNKNVETEKLEAKSIFPDKIQSQAELDSLKNTFLNLPFYRSLLYNPETNAWLFGVRIDKKVLNSKKRDQIVPKIVQVAKDFSVKTGLSVHMSGLPLIRSNMAIKINAEMRWFLLGSLLLSTIILFFFFRSLSTTLLSLAVVLIGVIFSFGTMQLFGYKITLLNALIPPLIVVIGVPNCIYFLNKYHTTYIYNKDKRHALIEMVSRMGIVTLFCNISAAIGFAVFALTKSSILKEFGVVAGINIMAIFIISFILIPTTLSYLDIPKQKHLKYLDNKWLARILLKIEYWVFNHKKFV
ncbi:MAG: efflux RND transporter permease subunit, partial [Chitinophagaceae bacterium]